MVSWGKTAIHLDFVQTISYWRIKTTPKLTIKVKADWSAIMNNERVPILKKALDLILPSGSLPAPILQFFNIVLLSCSKSGRTYFEISRKRFPTSDYRGQMKSWKIMRKYENMPTSAMTPQKTGKVSPWSRVCHIVRPT